MFHHSITTILVSRFLLHLQAAHRHAISGRGFSLGGGGDGLGGVTSMEGQNSVVFQRVIGSLGETIEPHKDGYFGRGYEYECEREVDADISPDEE